MEKSGWFDTAAFYDALDSVRQARRLNWKQVAGDSGVSASTLTRMAQGRRPDVDGLLLPGPDLRPTNTCGLRTLALRRSLLRKFRPTSEAIAT
jgi:transcriptional regulator with XRE-family HTH domain